MMVDGQKYHHLYLVFLYYLYLYLGEAQARKMGRVIYDKYKKELEVYKYTHNVYDEIIGSKEAVDKIIYAGITSQYGMTPERVCEAISGKQGVKQIGIATEAVVGIIVGIVTIISTALSIVLSIVGACLQVKYQEPEDPEFGTPGVDGEDISEIEGYAKKNGWLSKFGIAGGVLLLIYGLFK